MAASSSAPSRSASPAISPRASPSAHQPFVARIRKTFHGSPPDAQTSRSSRKLVEMLDHAGPAAQAVLRPPPWASPCRGPMPSRIRIDLLPGRRRRRQHHRWGYGRPAGHTRAEHESPAAPRPTPRPAQAPATRPPRAISAWTPADTTPSTAGPHRAGSLAPDRDSAVSRVLVGANVWTAGRQPGGSGRPSGR